MPPSPSLDKDGAVVSLKDNLSSNQSDFETRAKEFTYVDKTDALLAFLADGGKGIHLLLRARRCGKTMLLTMFRCFFEMDSVEATEQKRHLFTDTPLKISMSPLFDQYFVRHPVIHIDFSSMRGASWSTMLNSYNLIVKTEYRRQRKLGRFDGVTDALDRAGIDDALNGKIDNWSQNAFFDLSRILYEQTGKKVVLLIDEYDTPVVGATQKPLMQDVIEFFRSFYAVTLKTSTYIWGTLIVGILKMEQTGFFSGFNNMRTFTMDSPMRGNLSDLYHTAALFTEGEVEKMYNYYSTKRKLQFDLEDLRRWYGGYCSSIGKMLYNPWSVVRAFEESRLECFWRTSGVDHVLRDLVLSTSGTFKNELDILLQGKGIRSIVSDSYNIISSKIDDKGLRSILLYAGYLTRDPKGLLVIPNLELKENFLSWVGDYASRELSKMDLDRKSLALFLSAVDGPFHIFVTTLSEFIVKHLSYHIFGKDEVVHQTFLFGVFLALGEATFKVTMEEEGGDGRMDITMVERNGGPRAVIMELKIAKEGRSSPRPLAVAALRQIEEKRYREKLGDEITQLREYGISFRKKKCFVEGRAMVRNPGGRWRIENLV